MIKSFENIHNVIRASDRVLGCYSNASTDVTLAGGGGGGGGPQKTTFLCESDICASLEPPCSQVRPARSLLDPRSIPSCCEEQQCHLLAELRPSQQPHSVAALVTDQRIKGALI